MFSLCAFSVFLIDNLLWHALQDLIRSLLWRPRQQRHEACLGVLLASGTDRNVLDGEVRVLMGLRCGGGLQ